MKKKTYRVNGNVVINNRINLTSQSLYIIYILGGLSEYFWQTINQYNPESTKNG